MVMGINITKKKENKAMRFKHTIVDPYSMIKHGKKVRDDRLQN